MQNILSKKERDWKQWNLRIPLVLFLFGGTAALYQSFPDLYLFHNALWPSAQYIGGIILLFLLFEKIGVNKKSIHYTFGILLILIGLVLDFITGVY